VRQLDAHAGVVAFKLRKEAVGKVANDIVRASGNGVELGGNRHAALAIGTLNLGQAGAVFDVGHGQ
jgi:hypothetical protein